MDRVPGMVPRDPGSSSSTSNQQPSSADGKPCYDFDIAKAKISG